MMRSRIRITGKVAAAMFMIGLATGGVAGVAGAQSTGPTGPSPGYYQASTAGSCHGEFGDHEGQIARTSGSGFSADAPFGNVIGQDNAVGSCPYTGVPATPFPPR